MKEITNVVCCDEMPEKRFDLKAPVPFLLLRSNKLAQKRKQKIMEL